MGGHKSQRKGARVEREIVKIMQEAGFAAEKVSGAYRPGEDISVPLLGRDLRVEVKARKNDWLELRGWLEDRDMVVCRADREKPFVSLRLDLALEIAQAAELWKTYGEQIMNARRDA